MSSTKRPVTGPALTEEHLVVGLLLVLAFLLLALTLAGGSPSSAASPSLRSSERLEDRIRIARLRAHLVALERITMRNGGTRTAGSAGYDASARYVAERMRAAGYRVRLQPFAFPFFAERAAPLLRLAGGPPWRPGRDYATFLYSGSGRVEAAVVAVDLRVPSPQPNASTSGCEPSDFARFPRGAIALLQRGACTFRTKAENAAAAGASAAIVFNEGNPGRTELFRGTLGPPPLGIPVLSASFTVGEALRQGALDGPTGATATVAADVLVERRQTVNVLAESRAGDPGTVVVVGAHLDSAPEGPGMNDNASGSALVLTVAEALAEARPDNRVRFAWWGAEELGLLGSRRYVGALSPAERRRHALYLNFDMVGSPNFALFVYDGDRSTGRGLPAPPGSAAIERVFRRYFAARGLAIRETALGARSDHYPFARAGIPIGGLFTGASGRKTAAEAALFGGRAGAPYDPCYHRRCDTLANVSAVALLRTTRAAAHAVELFAHDVASVRRAR